MSYDIAICDPVTGETLKTEKHQIHGGTMCVGGTEELWTNETFNYSPLFRKALGGDGIKDFNGKQAAEVIPLIISALPKLNNDVDTDYWKPTEGNAKSALYRILALCRIRPDGILRIS